MKILKCSKICKIISSILVAAFFVTSLAVDFSYGLQVPLNLPNSSFPIVYQVRYSINHISEIVNLLEDAQSNEYTTLDDIRSREVLVKEKISGLEFEVKTDEVLIKAAGGHIILRYYNPERVPSLLEDAVSASYWQLNTKLNNRLAREIVYSNDLHQRLVSEINALPAPIKQIEKSLVMTKIEADTDKVLPPANKKHNLWGKFKLSLVLFLALTLFRCGGSPGQVGNPVEPPSTIPTSPTIPLYDGTVTVTLPWRFSTPIESPDAYAIRYAYENGGNGVELSGLSISFTKKDGTRLTQEEVDLIINTLTDMPGPNAASYYKKGGWESVVKLDNKSYWPVGPITGRNDRYIPLNPVEAEIYLEWQASKQAVISPDTNYAVWHENGYLIVADKAGQLVGKLPVSAQEVSLTSFNVTNEGIYIVLNQQGHTVLEYASFNNLTPSTVTLPVTPSNPQSIQFIRGTGFAYIADTTQTTYLVNLVTGEITISQYEGTVTITLPWRLTTPIGPGDV